MKRAVSRRKNVYFVSDLHFGLSEPETERQKEAAFHSFLGMVAKRGDALFIVGDLFDYWFEYRHVIPGGYHHILSQLGRLVEDGLDVQYIAGNHDFWLRDYFPRELGIPVHKEPLSTTIRGKRFLIHHGDGLAEHDTGYRLMKKVLRNRAAIFLFSLLPPDLSASIAKRSSRASRTYTAEKDYGETDGMLRFAEEKIGQGFDVVVMGHRHEPRMERFGAGTYVNLGDWISHRTYAVFDGKKVALQSWDS